MAYYDYEMLTNEIDRLTDQFPFIEKSIAGKSVQGRDLYVLRLGHGKREVFYNGTHHALEWITTALLMRFVEEYAESYMRGTRLAGYNMRTLFQCASIYIMPMVNPDGVDMVMTGFKAYDNWQANARGVDLNHNYDSSWEKCKGMEQDYGIYGPGPTRYGGKKPESEPEVIAVTNFVRNHNIMRLLAFHSQGEEIYWDFEGMQPPESYEIGKYLAAVSGYTLSQPEGIACGGGCKDWFIKEFGRPGYTIEVGCGENPLPICQFDTIYNNLLELFIISSII